MTKKSIFFEFERCDNDLICAPEQQGIVFRVFSLKQVIQSLTISLCGVFNRVCFSTGKSVKKCDGCR